MCLLLVETVVEIVAKGKALVQEHICLFIPSALFFFLCCAAYLVFVLQPGIEPLPLAVEAQCRNHRTAREFPPLHCFGLTRYCLLPGL